MPSIIRKNSTTPVDPTLGCLLQAWLVAFEKEQALPMPEDDDYDHVAWAKAAREVDELENEIWQWATPEERHAFTQSLWDQWDAATK